LSNRSNLNVEQIQRLAVTLKKSECLRIAYEMKEEFREIYETHMTQYGSVKAQIVVN